MLKTVNFGSLVSFYLIMKIISHTHLRLCKSATNLKKLFQVICAAGAHTMVFCINK